MTKDNKILPAGVNYRYLTSNAAYAPQYCEQPLYYLLSFVSKQYQQLRQQEKVTGWFGKLREALRLLPNMEEFLLEIASLATRRIDGNQGYQILFGKGRI